MRPTFAERSGRAFHIRSPRDFWGTVTLIGLSAFAFWAASDLPGMRGAAFGPGTAPRLFAGCLFVLATGVAIRSLFADGPGPARFHLRGPLLVTFSILSFAGLIGALGLVITTFVCFMIAVSATPKTRWTEALITAAFFTVGTVAVFVYGLALSFALWPAF